MDNENMQNKDENDLADGSGNWEPDPYHRHEQRWWNGMRWSEKVRSNSSARIDPPGVIPNPVNRDAHDGPAEPLSGVKLPLRTSSPYVPHLLLVGLILLLAACVLGLLALIN